MGLYDTGSGNPGGNGGGQPTGSNLAFTKFLFVIPRQEDDGARTRMRAIGGIVARGFFNDFDTDGSATTQPFETVQFLVRDGEEPEAAEGAALQGPDLGRARYVVQVCSKYRPRLSEIEEELRRRLGDAGEVGAIDGAVRHPRYSSAELAHYSKRGAPPRRSGRIASNAVIVPIRKNAEWWAMDAIERNTYFHPHVDASSGRPAQGHAVAAKDGIPHLYRRLYYNPDGYGREGEFDFLTYFECDDEGLPVFDRVHESLRDTEKNPEWRFVEEGPVWKGRRVLKW